MLRRAKFWWFRSGVVGALLAVVIVWDLPQYRHAAFGQGRRQAPAAAGGEELFRAVVFLEGDTVEQIPELKRLKSIAAYREMKPAQQKLVRDFQARLIQELKKSDPDFLAEFNRDLRSGDRMVISKRLSDTATTIAGVVEKGNPSLKPLLDFDRQELAQFTRRVRSAMDRELQKDGPPDIRAIRAAAQLPQGKAPPREIEWLKGQRLPSADEPEPNQPDTDHNIAGILYTFIAVVVVLAVVVWLFKAAEGGGDLYRDQLVNSLATKLKSDAAPPQRPSRPVRRPQ